MTIPKPGIFPVTNDPSEGISRVILANDHMYAEISTIGATLCGVYLPSEEDGPVNVVLGYEDHLRYLTDPYYLGSTVGRMAGRINSGKLPVQDKVYQLTINDNDRHHLHGGKYGLHHRVFEILRQKELPGRSSVSMRTMVPDGEDGYPGWLRVTVTYTLTADHTLTIGYEAESDQTTHVNITNHAYFNLGGQTGNGLDQYLRINADEVLETDDLFIPTGKVLSVAGTPYDLNRADLIDRRKAALNASYFNECYLLQKKNRPDAVLYDPVSRRRMEMRSTYPSLIFYSGDYLNDPFEPCQGICLEAQFPPDAPNSVYARQTLLEAGDKYVQQISLRFSW